MSSLTMLFRQFSIKTKSFTLLDVSYILNVRCKLRCLSSFTKTFNNDKSLFTSKAVDIRSPSRSSTNKTNAGNTTTTDFKAISDSEWSKRLTPEQYCVCRAKGTEPPFTGKYYTHSESGTYTCSCCGSPLFSSESKYDSGSGWPSFYTVVSESVTEQPDWSMGVNRTEVLCSQCNAHLGHMFTDGPQPTGLRYCINSVCLNFTPKTEV